MAGKKKEKPLDKLKAFWKHSPELKRVADHIGKFIDRMTAEDLFNIIAGSTAAYAGFKAAERLGHPLESQLTLAGSGVMAYQIAKSPNNTASIGAMIYLSALGLMTIPFQWPDVPLPTLEQISEGLTEIPPEMYATEEKLKKGWYIGPQR